MIPNTRKKRMRPRHKSSLTLLLFGALSLFRVRCTNADKGKGAANPGHIIIQNELKGYHQAVPIYMPVPIPIPMPMIGHEPASKTSGHSNRNEGDTDVRRIYLLHPMQQQQNHPPAMQGTGYMSSPSGFGGGGEQATGYSRPQLPSQQQGFGDSPALSASPPPSSKHSLYSKSSGNKDGLKILPIVVIPPMPQMVAPMHLQPSSHAYMPMTMQKMVAASGGIASRGMHHQMGMSPMRQRQLMYAQDLRSFSDYANGGGGKAGSLFRENFASRLGYGRMKMPARRYKSQDSRMQMDEPLDDYSNAPRSSRSMRTHRHRPSQSVAGHNYRGGQHNAMEQRRIFDDDLDEYDTGNDYADLRVQRHQHRGNECCQMPAMMASRPLGSRRKMQMATMHESDYDALQDMRDSSSALGALDASESFGGDLDQVLSERIERKLDHDLLSRLASPDIQQGADANGELTVGPQLSYSPWSLAGADGIDSFMQQESRSSVLHSTNASSSATTELNLADEISLATTTQPLPLQTRLSSSLNSSSKPH